MRRLLVVAALVVVFGGTGGSPAWAQTDAVSVARALIDAENRHDVETAVNLFAPGAIVNLPTGARVTREAIEEWQRELAAQNFRAEITPPVAVTPEVVTFSGTIALDLFRRLGVSPMEANWQLTVQLGRITTLTLTNTPEGEARLRAALAGGGAAQSGGGPAQSGGGAAQSGGGAAQSGRGAAGGGGGPASTATAGTGRSLALTGAGPDLAVTGGAAIALGSLALFAGRRARA